MEGVMKRYAVNVAIQAGGCEKNTLTLVLAENEAEASTRALLAECHADLGSGAEWLEGQESISDCDGEFIYSIIRVREIPEEHYQIVKEYL